MLLLAIFIFLALARTERVSANPVKAGNASPSHLELSVLLLLLCSCSIEPRLQLMKPLATEVEVYTDVNIELLWQEGWESEWTFPWDSVSLGPLGYTTPGSTRLQLYALGQQGQTLSHNEYNFMGQRYQLDLFAGRYHFLFYNNDSEALLFDVGDDYSDIVSYTRTVSTGLKDASLVYTALQKADGDTKATEQEEEPVSLMPDGLFSLYDCNRLITDKSEDYICEDGKYILRIEGDLYPSTYIYLIQVGLQNNLGRVVGSNGAAITGMADGVHLMSRESRPTTASIPMPMYMSREQDLLGAKVYSYGLPGCNPYDAQSLAQAPGSTHSLVLSVSYVNGTYRNIRVDITDQVRARPLGGVISLLLDVNDFPPDESGDRGGSGFDAFIGDWQEESGETHIAN